MYAQSNRKGNIDLKLSVDFLGSLVAVPWDLAIPNLHEVCIPYLMRQDIPVNERNHVSHKLTEHLRFLSHLNGKKQIAKDLFNYYRNQSENLKEYWIRTLRIGKKKPYRLPSGF